MSAELHHPSIRVAIISEPNAQISFKFCLLLPLGHVHGRFLHFWFFFYEYFSFSLTCDPRAAKISKNQYSYKHLEWLWELSGES